MCELRVCWAVSCSGCGAPLMTCNIKRNHVNFLWNSTSPQVLEQQRASAQTLVTVRGPCATALKTTDIMMHLGAWGQTETEHAMCGTTSGAWSGDEGGRTAAHRSLENTHWPRTCGTCREFAAFPSRRATCADGQAAMIYTTYR